MLAEITIIKNGKEVLVEFEDEFTDTKIDMDMFGHKSCCDGKINTGLLKALAEEINSVEI